jgi:hypothetical protein
MGTNTSIVGAAEPFWPRRSTRYFGENRVSRGAPKKFGGVAGRPEASEGAAMQLAQRRGTVPAIWQRGVVRGDFRGDVDAEVAMDLLAGHAPLSKYLANSLVDTALGGLAATTSRTA